MELQQKQEELDSPETYQPRDLIRETTQATVVTGGAGLLVAAVQSTLTRQNIGALGVFNRYGGTIGFFAAVGGSWAFVSTTSANLRGKRDAWDEGLGGFAAGAVMGFTRRSLPAIVGTGVAVAVATAIVASTNDFLADVAHVGKDLYQDKTELRHRFRRPANEMLNQIGEGRGIYGPNYEQRRKERIKKNYGVDVPEKPWFMNSGESSTPESNS